MGGKYWMLFNISCNSLTTGFDRNRGLETICFIELTLIITMFAYRPIASIRAQNALFF